MGIKIRIEKELRNYACNINRIYSLNKLSPVLSKNIKEFICRDGKRIRPVLFCIGYLGFSKKTPAGLYRSALSLELLHDFLLVHDDIIDKSATRRGKPSMHALLDHDFCRNEKDKFSGQDLAVVTGDIIYAMAIDVFLTVKEDAKRKEDALKKLILSALYTGGGEFIELISESKPIEKVSQKDIYKIYDYKTANYTFASPLTIGATLAGAKSSQIEKLYSYGMLLGRAFQIKDDIIGIFGKEKETGKSNVTDILEAKKTLLIWYAFGKASKTEKLMIKSILESKSVKSADIEKIRKIIVQSGALIYSQNQIKYLYSKALIQIDGLKMNNGYKQALDGFSQAILKS
ncbi:MAG: polyprenyl synthetase family protein [Candidatus Omnitrophica bacterium]|nr:polyprenyl synthetase family protein [Candidatus Omnitrophota bacterium]